MEITLDVEKNNKKYIILKIKEAYRNIVGYLYNIIDNMNFFQYKLTIFSFLQFIVISLVKIEMSTIPLSGLILSGILFFLILLVEYHNRIIRGLLLMKFTLFLKYNFIILTLLLFYLSLLNGVSIFKVISSDVFVESFTKRGCRIFFTEIIFGVFLKYRRNKNTCLILICFLLIYFGWIFYSYSGLFMILEGSLVFLFYFSLLIISAQRNILSPMICVIINTTYLMYFFTTLDLYSQSYLII